MRVFFVLLLSLSACGPVIITDKGLSKSCGVDADCVAVFLGDLCATCDCPNSAISTSSKSNYDAELKKLQGWCGPRPAIACDCIGVTAVCTAGTCATRPGR